MAKNLTENGSAFRAAWRLGLVAVLAGYLILTNHAQASGQFICNVGSSSNGTTTWVSCGSSAGNYIYTCDSSGNCTAASGASNEALANLDCAQYSASGCPDPLQSDPLPEQDAH